MSLAECAAIVEKGDPDRFLAAMSCPPDAREKLFPLFAFNVEIARAPWVTQEAMIAEMRLQWWRDALGEIAAQKPVRKHEVVTSLAELIRQTNLPIPLLEASIEARRWDILKTPFENPADFSEHLNITSGNLAWCCALALGAPKELEKPIRDVAWAGGLANWFKAVPELENRGLLPLVDGRAAAISALAEQGLARLQVTKNIPFGAAHWALRPFWQARALLKKAARAPAHVANGSLQTSEFQRRTSLLYKTMLKRL